jgi:hypothetical protein
VLLTVIDEINSIGVIFSIHIRKPPMNAQTVVDDVNQNGVNTILFDVVLLPPNAPATPNTAPVAATPAAVVATNLPIWSLFFATYC